LSSGENELQTRETGGRRLGFQRFILRAFPRLASLRGQLIIPYVVLTLLTAMVGTFVVTRLVTSSFRERFVNQLYEASRVAADGVVRRERAQLTNLRLMTFTSGMPEALAAGNEPAVKTLLAPLAFNNQAEAVIAVDPTGREVVSLTLQQATSKYVETAGSDLSAVPVVARSISGKTDASGDKYVGIIRTEYGSYLFTGGPVRTASGDLAGAILVGTRLERLADDLKSESLADVAFISPDGQLITTSLATPDEGFGALLLQPGEAQGLSSTLTREFSLSGHSYQAAYSPWVVRGQTLGVLVTVLPSNFVVTTEATSRTTFSAIFAFATAAVMLVGFLLAQSIARPILRLRTMAQAVAAGDLEQSSGFKRPDEIGDLAQAFDVMTERLQARTAEAERLYGEAVERNRQLAEMYERLQTTQRQLVQSEKLAAVGQLAAGIVHDVKNPLGVIKGMAEELIEDSPNGSADSEAYRLIRDNATRANAIVTDLLMFARQSDPKMIRRDLRDTIEGALRLTDYLLRKGKVRIERALPETPVMVTYDPQQIQQVLINLFQNAVQAMPDGGELAVGLKMIDRSAVIKVQDTGCGIASEYLPRIFEPFFTTKSEGQGTGMGLAVSYGIISRHGGHIEVESVVGSGSTFTIRLPELPPEAVQVKEPVE
jgi:signal transduction histidine kinase